MYYMFSKGGQTTGPSWLTFFEETYRLTSFFQNVFKTPGTSDAVNIFLKKLDLVINIH